MNENTNRIIRAIDATRRVVPGYFEKTCLQRAGKNATKTGPNPDRSGSYYPSKNASEVESFVRLANWTFAIDLQRNLAKPEYTYFRAFKGAEGYNAILELRGVVHPSFDKIPVRLTDKKQTGWLAAEVSEADLKAAEFGTACWAATTSTLILSEEQGEEVVFTFHPGDPVAPSQIQSTPELLGKTVTIAEALALGFEYAKITI